MQKKVILFYLPPAEVLTPSASLSILKSFMLKNGFPTEIKYWNFALNIMREYTNDDSSVTSLIPFYAILNEKNNDIKVYNRIVSTLNQSVPNYLNETGGYENLLEKIKKRIQKIIQKKLKEIDWENVLLFGFTSKFYQWIPAMIIAEEIKKRDKNIPIIIGGFGNKDEASEILKKCSFIDFSVCGEGEYPLFKLAEKIKKDKFNYATVPGLVYREKDNILISECRTSEYLDMKNYPLPSHDDYEKEFIKTKYKHKGRYPINSVRGCSWNACKFCNYNQGYKYREREPEDIVNEIIHLKTEHNVYAFYFVDNDVFCNYKRFNKLLDLIIDAKKKNNYYFTFWGEMIPNPSLDESTFKKMSEAGFDTLFIGYDALTDVLLKKMNKRSTFAENLIFVKFAIKYKINLDVNIIRDIYNETEQDVQESIKNLHYLRFYFNKEPKFFHRYGTLNITTSTKYFKEIPEAEKTQFDYSPIAYLLPEQFSNDNNRFKLFRWNKSRMSNFYEWEKFKEIEQNYQNQNYEYEVIRKNKAINYIEIRDKEIIKIIELNKLQYRILKNSNQKISNIDSLSSQLNEKNIDKIKSEIDLLTSHYLIYRNSDYSQIISIIDV
ncbi:MAG: radical SAM protein [Bacteroidota bacterium]